MNAAQAESAQTTPCVTPRAFPRFAPHIHKLAARYAAAKTYASVYLRIASCRQCVYSVYRSVLMRVCVHAWGTQSLFTHCLLGADEPASASLLCVVLLCAFLQSKQIMMGLS